jgi:hypothetical protein
MAIVFINDIETNKLLNAFNNNVVIFYQNDLVRVALKAEILIGGTTLTLYPDPDGVFTYNFKQIITSLINQSNYSDDLIIDVDNSLIYNHETNSYKNYNISFKIFLDDDTNITITRDTNWMASYTQLLEYKRTNISNLNISQTIALIPQLDINTNKSYLKYWSGFPFDIPIYCGNTDSIEIKNLDNDELIGFGDPEKIVRAIISNGNPSEQSIDNTLIIGYGTTIIEVSTESTSHTIELEKIQPDCSDVYYFKFLNRYSKWSYWLFKRGKTNRTTKSLGFINNDNNNIEDTISPYVFTGKESDDVISLTYDITTPEEREILEDLFETNKTYLYIGTPGTSSFNDFVEVNIKAGSLKIKAAKRDALKIDLQVELPERTTRRL